MPRTGLTPDILVTAAATLADQAGFGALTLTALARQFNVKVASLYAHIANADDLNTRVALFALNKLADLADDAVAGRAGKDALVAVANVYRDFARQHPGLFEAARYRLSAPLPDNNGGARISRVTRAMLRGYALDDRACTDAMRLLGSVFLGYPMLELAGSFNHSQPDPHSSWLRSLDALDHMLRNWPTHKDAT
ncbi:AcrR family transcriptional regulator [Duganella sp. 1224]|uniref:TetR/AcrR family transcriptional regulator n=1 Tax=Duganella sp. 1224 TaxID=2587052 RepID=UPI0015CBCF05|nr:TetR-like C-terminal domain-containing protein [Duganella sp. 1224]NYE61084.1 AcrR family transcriptional regulator [Duganella sp. 1224]